MQTKKCKYCFSVFSKKITESQKNWIERHKYCSKKCMNLGQDRTKHKIRMKENNPMSHGGKIAYKEKSYKAIHAWVYRNLGKPNKCEDCNLYFYGKYKLHWSNESGKYLRKKEDWKRRCPKCHAKHDKKLYANT